MRPYLPVLFVLCLLAFWVWAAIHDWRSFLALNVIGGLAEVARRVVRRIITGRRRHR